MEVEKMTYHLRPRKKITYYRVTRYVKRQKKEESTEDVKQSNAKRPRRERQPKCPKVSFQLGYILTPGDRTENQDAFISTPSRTKPENKPAFWGVLDGHGPLGASASKEGGSLIEDLIRKKVSFRETPTDITQKLEDIFQNTHTELRTKAESENEEYGTTAVVALLNDINNKATLTIANCGDSRGVLYRTKTDGVEIAMATSDHNFDRADEVDRVESAGGIIVNRCGIKRVAPPADSDAIKKIAKYMNTRLGLSMSRALCHPILSLCGVIPDPEFYTAELIGDEILIVASDGLWGVLSNEEVLDFVKACPNNMNSLCDNLAAEIKNRCKKRKRLSDNQVILAIKFQLSAV